MLVVARGGSSEATRISKFEAKTAATVLYISITLSYAIDSEDADVLGYLWRFGVF